MNIVLDQLTSYSHCKGRHPGHQADGADLEGVAGGGGALHQDRPRAPLRRVLQEGSEQGMCDRPSIGISSVLR